MNRLSHLFSWTRTLKPWSRLLLVVMSLGVMASPLNRLGAQQNNNGDFSNYQNTPVSSILDIYEQLSGKRLIRDTNLTSQVPPVSINANGLSKAEMLKLIEATLLLNGVAIVPVDDQTDKVVVTPPAKNQNPRSEGVKIYANATDLPTGDQVVSYYMPLSYISPQEAQGIFSQSMPPHNYGAYVAAPTAQAVVLTDNVSVIRQLIALKELVDVPPAQVASEFIQLTHADAQRVSDLLQKMLDPRTTGATVPIPARVGNAEPLSNEHNLLSGTAQIVPDTRSNRLLVITRPVNMPFLKKLISEFDQPDVYSQPQRRSLRYVQADDILPALEAALAQGQDEMDEAAKQPAAPGTRTVAAAPGVVTSNTPSGVGGLNAVTPQLQAPAENDVPTVVTVGETRLMADNRSNSIIVFGSPDRINRVFAMIDELDRKPLQVYLATVIGELTVSEGQEFGIDMLQKFQKVGQGGIASSLVTSGTAASATTTGNTSVPTPASLISSLGFPLLQGLTLYGAIGSTLDAYVRALETTNRFKVVSRPSVYADNNKLAIIASGSQVPVPGNTTSGFTSDNQLVTSSTIQYEDVLLQLDIIPVINANHEVTLSIRQTNNTLGANQVISGNIVPTILTQEINTEVTVPDKATVVIGGLISQSTERDTSGVPWLSDIPLLGYLFKDTSKSKDRSELIIMIQPTVVETDADQITASQDQKRDSLIAPDATQALSGSFNMALPQPKANPNSISLRTSAYSSKNGSSPPASNPNSAPSGTAPQSAPSP